MTKTRLTLPFALSLLAAALYPNLAGAVDLPQTSPVVFSQVYGTTQLNADVYLADTEETLNSYRNIDYAQFSSQVRGATVLLGDTLLGRDFTQYGVGSPSVNMGASAQSNFGINKVRAVMVGANVPSSSQQYGSMPASASYQNNFMSGYVQNYWNNYYNGGPEWQSAWDWQNGRTLYVPAAVEFAQDVDGNFTFNADGQYYNDGNVYFVPTVPTTMPEVVINRSQSRSLQAYSRWEDIFYFGPTAANPANSGGTATIRLSIDGVAQGDSGGFQFQARDWAHKDSYGSYLASAYLGATPEGNDLTQTLDIAIDFIYGQPNYIKAEAWAWLYGEGDVDASNTVKITGIDVAPGTAVYSYGNYLAGTALGYEVSGGGVNGNASGGAGGFFGGGGVNPPVPEPGTYALMLTGLGLAGWLARRRRTA